MKKLSLLLFLLLLSSVSFSQNKNTFNESEWLGNWTGKLLIITAGKSSEVNMYLSISKTDTPNKYSWKTAYGEGASKLEKNYFMIAEDIENGKWILDEDNTILIDFFFGDNQFNSYFETQNILLSSRYELKNSKIYSEVLSAQKSKSNITGSGENEVISYPVYVIQKAELTRE
ncbi:MAG: hypothetical protein WC644_04940 [Ignavibacteria bacterium]